MKTVYILTGIHIERHAYQCIQQVYLQACISGRITGIRADIYYPICGGGVEGLLSTCWSGKILEVSNRPVYEVRNEKDGRC